MIPAIIYAAAYLTGIAVFFWMARRRAIATSGIMSLMAAGLIGGLVSANMTQWLFTAQPGKTVLGAVAGGYLAVVLYKRHLRITRPTGDLFAAALCAGEAVGRLGCFVGGCCYGKETDVAWAVWQHGALRHPTQLYMSIACVGILLSLWRFSRQAPPENGLFFLQGTLYCAARFAIEFFRESSALTIGLTTAQLACIAGFTFFGCKLYALMRPGLVTDRALS